MRYVALSRDLYERLHAPEGYANGSREESSALLRQIINGSEREVRETYKAELHQLLQATLRRIGAGTEEWSRLDEISYYEDCIPAYTSMFLFWVWRNGLPMDDPALSNLVQAVFEGMLGYRLIDVHVDQQKVGAEAIVLGGYLIRSHEHRLVEIFGADRALPILKKYGDLLDSVEYLEKSHRWQPCPFAWKEAERLGWKAAPLFAILHLMLEKSGRSEAEIDGVVQALCQLAAATQMGDDFADASEDLPNGIETLVASGFYQWNEGRKIEAARIGEFLDQRRVRLFLRVTLDLLNAAIARLESLEEPVFLLLAERTKSRLLQSCSVAPESLH